MLVIRQDNFTFLPCSTSKLTIFRMLSSFRIEIFRLRQETKMAEYFRISPFFCVVLTEKINLKPIHPYDQPAYPRGLFSLPFATQFGDGAIFVTNLLLSFPIYVTIKSGDENEQKTKIIE